MRVLLGMAVGVVLDSGGGWVRGAIGVLEVIAAGKGDVLFFDPGVFATIQRAKLVDEANRLGLMIESQEWTTVGQHAAMPAAVARTLAVVGDRQDTGGRTLEFLTPCIFFFQRNHS